MTTYVETLRKHLQTLDEITKFEQSHNRSKQDLVQRAIVNFISACLDAEIQANAVCESLDEIYHKELLLDNDTYRWCMDELEKQKKERNQGATLPLHGVTQQLNELYFNKELVQNALVACHILATNTSDAVINVTFPHSLCKVDISHSLAVSPKVKKTNLLDDVDWPSSTIVEANSLNGIAEEVSPSTVKLQPLSQSQRVSAEGSLAAPTPVLANSATPVHRYLMAKQRTAVESQSIYYIAFSSHEDLAQWKDNHSSFEEGMP